MVLFSFQVLYSCLRLRLYVWENAIVLTISRLCARNKKLTAIMFAIKYFFANKKAWSEGTVNRFLFCDGKKITPSLYTLERNLEKREYSVFTSTYYTAPISFSLFQHFVYIHQPRKCKQSLFPKAIFWGQFWDLASAFGQRVSYLLIPSQTCSYIFFFSFILSSPTHVPLFLVQCTVKTSYCE